MSFEVSGSKSFLLPIYCSNDSDAVPAAAVVVVDRDFEEFLDHVRGLIRENGVQVLDFSDDHLSWSVPGIASTTCHVSANAVWWQAEMNDAIVKTEEVAFTALKQAA